MVEDRPDRKIISIDELYGVYKEARGDELIVDLRPGTDYREMHIEDSLNIPFNRLQLGSFDLKKIKRAYMICKTGSEAPMGAKQMQRLYPEVEIYYIAHGGFDEWIEKKYPLVSAKVLKLKNTVELEQNEPDFINLKKMTRLVPLPTEEWRSRIEGINYFTDHQRNCYLISDLKRKESILINPLIEIHHHIIDQIVRLGCECAAILYDEHFRWNFSPPPESHAKDFSQLTGGKCYSFSSVHASKLTLWSGDLISMTDDHGHNGILYKGIAFHCKQFSSHLNWQWLSLEIC